MNQAGQRRLRLIRVPEAKQLAEPLPEFLVRDGELSQLSADRTKLHRDVRPVWVGCERGQPVLDRDEFCGDVRVRHAVSS